MEWYFLRSFQVLRRVLGRVLYKNNGKIHYLFFLFNRTSICRYFDFFVAEYEPDEKQKEPLCISEKYNI